MARRRAAVASRHLRTLFDVGAIGGLTDRQLLEQFSTGHREMAEAAFAILVERHGPMVLRVCRGVLGDSHDVHDTFQATFLVLVRKAGSLWVRDSLGPWLHGVAFRVATKAKVAAARRKAHERRAAEAAEARRGGEHDTLGSMLHEEVDRLPAKYRAPDRALLSGRAEPRRGRDRPGLARGDGRAVGWRGRGRCYGPGWSGAGSLPSVASAGGFLSAERGVRDDALVGVRHQGRHVAGDGTGRRGGPGGRRRSCERMLEDDDHDQTEVRIDSTPGRDRRDRPGPRRPFQARRGSVTTHRQPSQPAPADGRQRARARFMAAGRHGERPRPGPPRPGGRRRGRAPARQRAAHGLGRPRPGRGEGRVRYNLSTRPADPTAAVKTDGQGRFSLRRPGSPADRIVVVCEQMLLWVVARKKVPRR